MKPQFNLQPNISIKDCYLQGLLPQRNKKGLFYKQTSCRSNLKAFKLSSENRRILKKTNNFSFTSLPLLDFNYTHQFQSKISSWTKSLNWKFPTSSIKTIFQNHIFNTLYIWKDNNNNQVAYSICLFKNTFSHIAYVFYHPQYQKSNLPIRLTLQTVIDSHQQGLTYCYLGRFAYYKRTMPGFQNFVNGSWQTS